MAPDSALTNYVAPTSYNDMATSAGMYTAEGGSDTVKKLMAPMYAELAKSSGGGQTARPWSGWSQETAELSPIYQAPPAPPAEPTLWGEVKKGFVRNIDETQGMLYGAAGMAGDLVGSEKLRDWGFEGFKRNEEEAKQNAAAVGRIEDIHSGRDFALWASGTAGALAPTAIGAIATSGVGAAIGGRALGSRLFGTAIQEVANKTIAEHMAAGFTREAAIEAGNLAARKAALATARNYGAQAGLVGYTTALEGGGNWTKDMEEHGPGKTKPGQDLFFGFLSGLTESIMGAEGSIIRKVTGVGVTDQVERSFRRALVTELGKNIGKEAGQEGFQEILSSVNANIQDGRALLTENDLSGIINAAAAGAVGGVGFGAFEALGTAKKEAAAKPAGTSETVVSDAQKEMDLLVQGHKDRVLQAHSIAADKFGLKMRELDTTKRSLSQELAKVQESGDKQAEKGIYAQIAKVNVEQVKLKKQYDQVASLEQQKLEAAEKKAGKRIANAYELEAAEKARVARLMAGDRDTYNNLVQAGQDVSTFTTRQSHFIGQRLNGIDAAIANMNSRLEGVWSGWVDPAQTALIKEQLDKLHTLRDEQLQLKSQFEKQAADIRNDIDKFGTTSATADGQMGVLDSKIQALFGKADNRTHILPELFTTSQIEAKQRELDAKKAKAEEGKAREARSEEHNKAWRAEFADAERAVKQAEKLRERNAGREGRGTTDRQMLAKRIQATIDQAAQRALARDAGRANDPAFRAYIDSLYERARGEAAVIMPPAIQDAGSVYRDNTAQFEGPDASVLDQARPISDPSWRLVPPAQGTVSRGQSRIAAQQEQLARAAKQAELAQTFESDLQGVPQDRLLEQAGVVGDPNALAGPSLPTWGAIPSDYMGAAPFQTAGEVAALPQGMDQPTQGIGPARGQVPGRGVHPMDVGRTETPTRPYAQVVPGTPQTSVSTKVTEVQGWVKSILNRLPGLAQNVSFVTDEMLATLPADMQRAISKGAAGIFWNGKVLLVPQNLQSKQHAVRTVIHEGIVHYGFRVIMDDGQRQHFMKLVHSSFKDSKEWKRWISNHHMYSKLDELTQAEEFVARFAEKQRMATLFPSQSVAESAWTKVKSFIRSVLSKLGMTQLTEDHLITMLQASSLHLANPTNDSLWKGRAAALLYEMGYHGSGKRGIDRFKIRYIGSGSGASLFGSGHYIAFGQTMAEGYMEEIAQANFKRSELSDDLLDLAHSNPGAIGAVAGEIANRARSPKHIKSELTGAMAAVHERLNKVVESLQDNTDPLAAQLKAIAQRMDHGLEKLTYQEYSQIRDFILEQSSAAELTPLGVDESLALLFEDSVSDLNFVFPAVEDGRATYGDVLAAFDSIDAQYGAQIDELLGGQVYVLDFPDVYSNSLSWKSAVTPELASRISSGAQAALDKINKARPTGASFQRLALQASLMRLSELQADGKMIGRDVYREAALAAARKLGTYSNVDPDRIASRALSLSGIAGHVVKNSAGKPSFVVVYSDKDVNIVDVLYSMPEESNAYTELTHVSALEQKRAAMPTTARGKAAYLVGEITGYRRYTEDGQVKKHGLLEKLVEMGADAHRRIQVVQRYLKETGGSISSASNLYKHLTGMSNRMAQDVGTFWDTLVSNKTEGAIGSLLRELKIAGVENSDIDLKMAHVGDMLHALHGLERNRSIRARSDGKQMYSSGWTDKQCQEILNRYRGNQTMDQIVAQVQRINAVRLDLLERHKIFPKEVLDAWKNEYKYYVPLKNWDEIVKEIDPGYAAEHGRSGLSVGSMASPRATGRATLAQNPLIQSINQTVDVIRLGHKVEAGRVLLNLVEENKDMKDIWELGEKDKVRFVLKSDKETGELVWTRRGGDQFTASGVPVVTVIDKDGNHVRIGVHDRALAKALRGENIVHAGPVLSYIGKLTRMMAVVNTNLSPAFILTNPIRDIETALMNLGNVLDENKRKGLLAHANDIRTGVLADIVGLGMFGKGRPVAKTLHKILSGKELKTQAEIEIYNAYQDFKRLGGHTRMMGLRSFDDVYTDLRKEGRSGRFGMGQMNKALDALDTLSNVAENATRLSVFMRVSEALVEEVNKQGLSGVEYTDAVKHAMQKASNISLELTVNFTRKGGASPIFNSLYMFASASIAGNKRMLQNIFRRGDTHAQNAARLTKYLGGAAAAQLILASLCRSMMGNDDDGINYYDKIPNHVKDNNIVLPSPFGDGKYIKIPVAYGYNIFWSIANGIDQVIHGQSTPGRVALNSAKSMFDSFSPIGGYDEGWTKFVPTIFRPVAQVATNKNFTGSPIKPESTHSYQGEVPESQKYWSTVSPIAKFIAQDILNIGGDKHRSGFLDVSPEVLEHLTGSYLGGAGRTASDIVNTAMNALSGKETPLKEMPIIRRVAGDVGYQETLGMYNDIRKEILTQKTTVETAMKEGVRGQELMRLRSENKAGMLLDGTLTQATNTINDIRKQEKDLELRLEQGKISDDAYRARKEKLEAQKERSMKQVIKAAGARGLSYARS